MLKKIQPWLKGFFTAYAMRAVVNAPILSAWYEDKTQYVTDSVYELLGPYDFVFLLLWIVCGVFFVYLQDKGSKSSKGIMALSLVFSLLLPAGQALIRTQTLWALFASLVNILKTCLMVTGFFLFFKEGLSFLSTEIQKKNYLRSEDDFFTEHIFFAGFLVLETVYLLCVLTNFPGNLCYDTEGQMMQVLGEMPYSTHHPLFGTLLMGLPVKLSVSLFHAKAPGIFLYMVLQTCMLSASLAGTLYVLKKKGLKTSILMIILAIYAITPIYSNIASTAVKDVPFISAFIGYFVCLTLVSEDETLFGDRGFVTLFVIMQILTCLLRKNGYYIIVLTGIIISILTLRRLGIKQVLGNGLKLFIIGVILAKIMDMGLAVGLNAEKGSAGEAFSLPFQITARYIDTYFDELTEDEIEVISGVLGDDMYEIADRYDPYLADAVKTLYNRDEVLRADKKALIKYAGMWIKMFFKHPGVYIDGFFVHTFGWYCPNVSTTVRYETFEDDFYEPSGVFKTLDKVMVFVYRFADRISLLGALQNAALWIWVFWFVTYLQKKNSLLMAGIPLWVSFVILLMAPGFMEHTRYAFPIMMTMPFFLGITLININSENSDEKA